MRPDVNSREMQSQRKMQIYCCKYKLEMQIQNWEVFLISFSCFIIHYSIWPISPMVAWPIDVILYLVANISIHGLPICQATLWYSPFIGVPQGGIEFVTRLTGQRDGSWSGCVEAVEAWWVYFLYMVFLISFYFGQYNLSFPENFLKNYQKPVGLMLN